MSQEKQIFTLSQVTKSIETTIANRYSSAYWIKAEMNRINWYPHSGHAYPDLLEKKDGRVISQIRAIIWKSNYDRIQESFKKELGEPLKDGSEILFLARISYHSVHGLSLSIEDIDVQFSLGSLEKERQASIQTLQKEGVFDLNRNLPFPRLPQKIAVISVETSKGFADFKKTLIKNPHQYKFYYKLFPAILQGERAVMSIRFQLQKIKQELDLFDIVVITRGGGDEVGLSAFNHVDLSRDIATFPIPVLTGIGHAVNLSVVDMIAYYHAITPTQIAQFLIDKMNTEDNLLKNLSQVIIQQSELRLQTIDRAHLNTQKQLQLNAQKYLIRWEHQLEENKKDLVKIQDRFIKNNKDDLQLLIDKSQHWLLLLNKHKNQLKHIEQSISLLDPINVLKRGFSIIKQEEKVISESDALKESTFRVVFKDGELEINPQKIKKL